MDTRNAAIVAIALCGYVVGAAPGQESLPARQQPTSAPAPQPQQPVKFICGTTASELSDRSFNNRVWPAGIVPFEFIDDITQNERDHMLEAMDLWTVQAGVHFVHRGSQADFVTIRRSNGDGVSWAGIGRQGGEQFVAIHDSHWNDHHVIAHELCHTMGFHHEQERPDRDDFVVVNFENIPERSHDQFNIARNDTIHTPYDYDSIMHYGACTFSNCNICLSSNEDCRTITTLDPSQQNNIGQRTHLSDNDIADMRAVYGPRRARYVTRGASNGVGTLFRPFGTIADGLAAIPVGGLLLLDDAGTPFSNTGVFRQASEWRASGGSTVIGR